MHRHAGRLRGGGEPVVGGRRDDLRDLDAVLRKRLEHHGAEIAGSDQRAFHEFSLF